MTRRPTPAFPFIKAHKTALPGFDVSLAFLTPKEAQRLNVALRGKDYVPNVLSYRTSETSGEILICLAEAKKQAPDFDLTYTQFTGFLFIHGLMHLEGKRHGPTMEKTERALFARVSGVHYSSHEAAHRNGHRHRDPSGQDSRR